MKWVFYALGVILAAVGAIWILQGINVLRAGFMAGQMQYAVLGVVALIAGVVLLVFGNHRGRAAS